MGEPTCSEGTVWLAWVAPPTSGMNCMVWGDRLGRTQTETQRCARRVQK